MESIELKKVLKSVAILVFILSLFLVVKILGEIKANRYIGSDIAPQNIISVNGRGEIFKAPDMAEFYFSVEAEALTSGEAQTKVTEKINPILAALKENGIEEKDIKTSSYNLSPRYEYPRSVMPFYNEGNRTLVGYDVNQTVTVKVRKIDDAGKILGLVGELGATNLGSISLTVDNDKGIQREARKMAIDDAETKAKELAKDLGVKLVRIVSFSESGPIMPMYARTDMMKFESSGVASAPTPEIPVGENQFVSDVYITYEIK